MKTTAIAALTALIAMSGCANRSASIKPSFVSFERFTSLECPAINDRLMSSRNELFRFSQMQDQKANGDAVGVFLLGVPFSKLSGDHEADVARVKGEIEALETAQIKNKCASYAGGGAASTPVQAMQQTPTMASTPSVQTRLEALRRMHADGLITQPEYDEKRKKILESL